LGAQDTPPPAGMSAVHFVQVGVGADQHGQDVTKAACRAVHNAIEFNRRVFFPSVLTRQNAHC
jgi:uncharacterized protein (TIGR02058 family)